MSSVLNQHHGLCGWDPYSKWRRTGVDEFTGRVRAVCDLLGYAIVRAGMDGDGLQAILRRPDGTLLGVEGTVGLTRLEAEGAAYVTPQPEWWGWGIAYENRLT